MPVQNVIVRNNTLEDTMYYRETAVLSYKINCPLFLSPVFQGAALRISLFYRANALAFEHYCRTTLYRMAVEQYRESMEHDYPVREFQAEQNYTVTYRQNCTLSLYYDRYEYTGGAHGNTVRRSDTWNLQTGRRLSLSQLFPGNANYRTYLIRTIQKQIADQIKAGDNPYFEDYEKNVSNSFNQSNFYLKPEGLVIYFQLYEIAPYAAGIREFVIPYSPRGPRRPMCGRAR